MKFNTIIDVAGMHFTELGHNNGVDKLLNSGIKVAGSIENAFPDVLMFALMLLQEFLNGDRVFFTN